MVVVVVVLVVVVVEVLLLPLSIEKDGFLILEKQLGHVIKRLLLRVNQV